MKDNTQKELQRIMDSIPKTLKEKVIKVKPKYDVLKELFEKCLIDKDFPEEKKRGIKAILEAKMLEKEEIVEDPKIAKQIDEYVAREIKKSIKAGRLPSKRELSKDEFIKYIKKLNGKIS